MKQLERYLYPVPRYSVMLWLAAAFAAGCAILVGAHAFQLNFEVKAINERIERLEKRRATLATAKPSAVQIEAERQWAEMRQERDFPWDSLFRAIERADSIDIELLEFIPDKRAERITLRGEAKDTSALISYVDTLAMQAMLSNVHIVHQQDVEHGTLKTVSFEVKASLVQ